MNFLIFLVVFYIILSISLMGVFNKAAITPTKALIPGLNLVEWCKLVGRPGWWAVFFLVPIVNLFMYTGLMGKTARSFSNLLFWETAIAVILGPIYLFYLGYSKNERYNGPILTLEQQYLEKVEAAKSKGRANQVKKMSASNPYRKSGMREWAEALIFAIFAAALIRMFLIEAYKIPTSSMEGSLLVGDYLFVSKANYGIRTPQTIAMIPLLHNIVPGLGAESYWRKPSLKMTRLPALEKIDRNEPIVFNYPEGDSIYVTPGRNFSVHDVRRQPGLIKPRIRNKRLRVRPIDKRDHYIKRCIAEPGDKLEIKDRQVYINDKAGENPTNMQLKHVVSMDDVNLNPKKLDEWGINLTEIERTDLANAVIMPLTFDQVDKLRTMKGVTVDPLPHGKNPNYFFPHDPVHFPNWTVDNYGPIVIPKAGETIDLKPETIALYRRVIKVYEQNTLEEKEDGTFLINGKDATTYTFKQDYYWAMGDNRHNSEDSRVWGFVPADHIVGKPLFIWFSTKNGNMGEGINWNRLFTSANKM